MISLAARGGIDIYSIIDQLKSSGTCPSYAVRTATKHDTYNYDIDAVCGRYVIDAKSIMGLLSLGIPKEIFIVIHTNNKDVISKFEEDISKWKVEE